MHPQPTPDNLRRHNEPIEGDPDRATAETDQDVDTAGTEADESAVGTALDKGAARDKRRTPSPDRP